MTWVAFVPIGVVVAILIAGTVAARRSGYRLGGATIVRCRSGHVFTTIWVPGASFKAVRLGWVRFQFCPVGRHWTLVAPVRDDDLSADDRLRAQRWHDTPVP